MTFSQRRFQRSSPAAAELEASPERRSPPRGTAKQPTSTRTFHLANLGDIRAVCQVQFEQLAAQLPLLAAWVIYQIPNGGDRQSIAYTDPQCADSTTLAYLESEVWLNESFKSLEVSQLSIHTNSIHTNSTHTNSIHTNSIHPATAYVCLLDHYSASPEYLLVWTYQPLLMAQQHQVEQCAHLLSYYLAVYQECTRQRLATQLLEQVVQRVEHQLRNPLALIGLYAENLRLALASGPLQDHAMLIRETVSELSSHLTDLIYCGQRSNLRLALYDLRTLLIDSIKTLQPWIEQKQLQIEYPDRACTLTVDCWQIKQVLSNLLSNAIHFSPIQGVICWNWQLFQREVLIEVRDRGPGLSAEDLQHAFTPFYSRRPGGTGLGLAIAQKIILDHQGTLWVQNLPDGGAQFSMTLPNQMSFEEET